MQHPPAPTSAPPAPPAPVAARRRIDGIDLARGLAIIGMISVHVAPPLAGEGGWYAIPYGRSSSLFALVAGLGIALSTRRGSFGDSALRMIWRAVWLAPVGVGLMALGTPVAVILQYYAIWFLLAIPFLRAPTGVLVGVTGVGIVLGPLVLVWAQVVHPEWYIAGRGVWLGEFGDVLLTGYYPTVSWIWLVYAGMALARLDLSSSAVAGWLTGTGTTVAVLAYGAADLLRSTTDLGRWAPLLDTAGHADTPFEQVASLGTAIAVLGVCLLLGQHLALLVRPVVDLGRFALTVYVGHLLVYAVARPLLYSNTAAEGATTTAAISLIGAGIAMAWLTVLPRGPLESLDRAGHRYLAVPLVRSLRGLRT